MSAALATVRMRKARFPGPLAPALLGVAAALGGAGTAPFVALGSREGSR